MACRSSPTTYQPDANGWDSFRLIEAISLLKAFSLVSTDIHDGFLSVSMHPLTHAWAGDRQEILEQHESWVTTGCLMALSCEDDVLWRRHGRIKEAVLLLEQVVKIQEQTAEDYSGQLASQHALAGAYQANGQVKAVSLLKQVVKIREQTLAEDYSGQLVSQHMLAGAYSRLQLRVHVGIYIRTYTPLLQQSEE